MSRLFWVNRTKTGFGVEWSLFAGGYAAVARWKVRLMQRLFVQKFFTKPTVGASIKLEREFIVRFEFGTDNTPRTSFLDLNLWNSYEARWVYLVFKVWPEISMVIAFNLGWRLTMESRKFLQSLADSKMRDMMQTNKVAAANKKGGVDPWQAQGHKLKVV
jgi:hypothetical protein